MGALDSTEKAISVPNDGAFRRVGVFARRYGRWVLLVVGVAAMVLLVRSVGVKAVLGALAEVGPWFPLILALEFLWVSTEGLALLVLYGRKAATKIPVRDWVQATLVHYTAMAVLPVGRAGAEVARATLLSRHVGGTRAAAGAALMQSLVLVANTLISFVCLFAVIAAPKSNELGWLLFGNGVVTLLAGGGIYVLTRKVKIGGFLGRRFERLAKHGPELDEHFEESRSRHWKALMVGLLGRSIQTVQYGVMLVAVTGAWSLGGTMVSQGVHLVGAGLGDMVPNQVGVSEGVFSYFAHCLGLAEHPEKALAIALVARISALSAAGLAAVVVQLFPRPEQSREEAGTTEQTA